MTDKQAGATRREVDTPADETHAGARLSVGAHPIGSVFMAMARDSLNGVPDRVKCDGATAALYFWLTDFQRFRSRNEQALGLLFFAEYIERDH